MMRFTSTVGAIRDALAPGLKIVSSKQQVTPILANVLLEAKGGQVRLTCSNLDQVVVGPVECDMEAEGSITVAAHVLGGFLSSLPSAAPCSLALGDGNVVVKSGRSRATLRTLTAEDFPRLKEDFSFLVELPSASLRSAIVASAYAAETSPLRICLCGVNAAPWNGGIDFIATDGHRLSLAHVPVEARFDPVILPSFAVKQFASLLGDKSGDATLELSNSLVRLSIGGASITTKTIDGTFPRYRVVTDVPTTENATVRVPDLAAALKVVASTNKEGGSVEIAFADGQCTVSAYGDSGEGVTTMDADVKVPIAARFAADYLAEALGEIEGDLMRVCFSEAKTAMHMFGKDGARHAILMTRSH
jgi:DNA polymerase III subunit beta